MTAAKKIWIREFPATACLLGVYILLFALMTIHQGGIIVDRGNRILGFMRIDSRTLLAFGALEAKEVLREGQYWRLITATLLHGSLLHLLFNGFALYQLGKVIEDWYEAGLMIFLHLLFGVMGNIGSLAYYAPRGVFIQVGASGALFGFIAFIAMWAWHSRSAEGRRIVRVMTFWILFGLLLGVLFGADNACHLSGAIAGLIVGNFEMLIRPDTLGSRAPRWLGLIATLIFGSSFALEYFRPQGVSISTVQRERDDRALNTPDAQRTIMWQAHQMMAQVFQLGKVDPPPPNGRRAREYAERVLEACRTRLRNAEMRNWIAQTMSLLHSESDAAFLAEENLAALARVEEGYEAWAKRAGIIPPRAPARPSPSQGPRSR